MANSCDTNLGLEVKQAVIDDILRHENPQPHLYQVGLFDLSKRDQAHLLYLIEKMLKPILQPVPKVV